MCHFIITNSTIDYKEQVVITDVKSGVQNTICIVLNCKRENLDNLWFLQTQGDSKSQVK